MTRTGIRVVTTRTVLASLAALALWPGASSAQRQIDSATQRNGMHSCPVGQFVVGHHAGQNLLLCEPGPGDFTREMVDHGTQVQGMHACPEGQAMTGVHVDDNLLSCAPVGLVGQRFVDNSTQAYGMHACPEGAFAVGRHITKNLLLCLARDSAAEIVDAATQRNGMHSCPTGYYVSGVHVVKNLLACYPGGVDLGREVVDSATQSHGMHACPEGLVMTGVHVVANQLACAPWASPVPSPRNVDKGTQRFGMHTCAEGVPMSGLHAAQNLNLCGNQYVLRIRAFTATPSNLARPGDTVALGWDVECTASDCAVTLSGGTLGNTPVQQTGTRTDTPPRDTTYVLRAESGGGVDSRSVRVTVSRAKFFFRVDNPDSTVRPCYMVSIEAPDLATARAIAQQQCTNCAITEVTETQYNAGCGR